MFSATIQMKLSLIVITENDYVYRTRSDDKCDNKKVASVFSW